MLHYSVVQHNPCVVSNCTVSLNPNHMEFVMTIRVYAQFFICIASTDPHIAPIPFEACGERSIIILDGRTKRVDMLRTAKEECIKRKYEAFQLRRGELRAHGATELSPVIMVRDYNQTVKHLIHSNSI